MTTYPHELTECEDCGAHYCMGCAGEECPNCKLQEVAFYGIKLEQKIEAVKNYCEDTLEETKDFPNWMVVVRKLMREILKILEGEG